MEKYPEEFINYIFKNTEFINDNIFEKIKSEESNKDLNIISFIEQCIEKKIFSQEKNCIIFYLKDLTENDSLRKELLDKIYNKYTNNNIIAKEIPEINFILVYNISEEKFIKNNLDKLQEYFDDYLSQLKENEEYEELKKKIMEDEALEEIEEQERRQRFILPVINSCEIKDVSENEVIINVPLIEENEILDKNKLIIKDCLKKYSGTKIEYIIYLYYQEKNSFEKYIFPTIKENIIEEKRQYIIKISNLIPDKIYMFLIGIKFAKNYSLPTFNKFYFMTQSKKNNQGQLFVYGNKNYKNNLVEEKSRIILPNNIPSYKSCFKNETTIFPLLYKTLIKDLSLSDTRICYIPNDKTFSVWESGSIISIQPGDIFEGSFPKEKEIIYLSKNNYFLEYFDSNSFKILEIKIKIKKIRVGAKHCLALSTLGECYSWGENNFGQLGLGIGTDAIVGNPQKIKFEIFDNSGNKNINNLKPLFYDIAAGNYFSLALGMFNNKQVLFFWGNGSGILNDETTNIIQSIYPKQIYNLENITNIFAKYNSIGITCFNEEKKINILYIHGTQKFGIDNGLELYHRSNPIIVNFFKEINFDVYKVNFSITCMSVIGKNINSGKIEVYLRGELTKKLFEFKEYKTNFYKIENNWSDNILAVSPQEKVIFFLLKNGIVKKLYIDGKKLIEKDYKIEGYDLKNFDINNLKNIEFQSFKDENFVVFYKINEGIN